MELLQAMLAEEEEGEQQDGAPPKPGTMQWYRLNRDEPVAPGCELTIFQAAYCLLRSKLDGKMTDKSFAGLVHLAARGSLCPQPNTMPRCGVVEHFPVSSINADHVSYCAYVACHNFAACHQSAEESGCMVSCDMTFTHTLMFHVHRKV